MRELQGKNDKTFTRQNKTKSKMILNFKKKRQKKYVIRQDFIIIRQRIIPIINYLSLFIILSCCLVETGVCFEEKNIFYEQEQ